MNTATEAPRFPQECYPPRPTVGPLAEAQAVTDAIVETARPLRARRDELVARRRNLGLELHAAIAASKSPTKLLSESVANESEIRDLDAQLAALEVARHRASFEHSRISITKADPFVTAWTSECSAIQREWAHLEAESHRRYGVKGSNTEREAWLIDARHRLAGDAADGRFAVKVG